MLEPVGVAGLVAAQPVLVEGVVARDVGVGAGGVGVPDVDGRALDGRAVMVGVEDLQAQRERHAGLDRAVAAVGPDV